MRIAQRRSNVGAIEHPLHEFEIPGLAQRLGREIMSEIVEAEADDASDLAQPMPVRAQSGERNRIAPALDPLPVRPHRDIGKDKLRMVATERPENLTNGRGDRN